MSTAVLKKERTALDNVTVVLVGPQGSGNVGSVARAMMNTGLSDLALIDPCDYINNEALSMACKADSVLTSARVYGDFDEYTKDAGVLVGFTRRMGKLRHPILTIDEATPKILELADLNPVSLLFGRVDRGLTGVEIARCDILVEIPTSSEYPSINLSHAVFTACYGLFTARTVKSASVVVAPREELEKMFVHLESALRAVEYGDKGGEHLLKTIMRNFRRLFGRTGLMQKEINMLRGIFTQIEERTEPKPEA